MRTWTAPHQTLFNDSDHSHVQKTTRRWEPRTKLQVYGQKYDQHPDKPKEWGKKNKSVIKMIRTSKKGTLQPTMVSRTVSTQTQTIHFVA